ncbi:MAG: valine--tRNA ligase [Candidatus Omnitrophica bacterium]|nr:valine--tRNA ligase [Candidatus Omnitrophota bacterium]
MNEIPSCYNPKNTEDKWYKFWEENGLFSATPNPSKEPFCIVIPPPNVTGILHMGHALNNTIQDILIRYHRMKGYETLWLPGTDHAGIATQNVVEKQIAKDGLTRQELGREKFIEKVWQWKEKYGSTIIQQLKKLGASCDWKRLRFTMDDAYSDVVNEVFIRLYEKELIYQGDYIINWCPRCQTALSDEEAPHQEIEGHLYYIKYPLASKLQITNYKSQNYIVVATTRPETMLGDTAVAVHPKDRRYKKFIGKSLILPLINREIKIIADEMVDRKFGTGAVKVTPAHDPNDYLLGKKYKLDFINIMNPDGTLNENASIYKGLDRFAARKKIIEDLKSSELLEKIVPYKISAGHCYRCHTLIEPYLSRQWFVKMKPLAKPAIEVVKRGKIKFYPKRWTKVYLNWMENIQDWCISRQIWWGHRIPVYYCRNCQQIDKLQISNSESPINLKEQAGLIISREKPEKCPLCGSTDIYQDEDVLDTWFSSWLWPFATFYWPKESEDLKYFYPTSVLVTAPEIIFFWVARMIMAGLEFMQDIPFHDVYIHGTVRDIEGRKMSKSLGNIIDPLEIIEYIGADALRFSLIMITATGQDVFLSEDKFKTGRNFCNKIWNAARLILMNLDKENINFDLCIFFKEEKLSIVNRWILSTFYSTLKKIEKAIRSYNFNEYANLLYHFFWHQFCDWYLEIIKPNIKEPQNQLVMYKVLEKFLRCLHPIMPFITEEIWQRLPHRSNSIMIESWPHIQEQIIDKKLEDDVETIFEIITAIRNLRKEFSLNKDLKLNISLYIKDNRKSQLIISFLGELLHLAGIDRFEVLKEIPSYREKIGIIVKDINIFMRLKGLIDVEKEKKRINKERDALILEIKRKIALLKNNNFIKKAPSAIVEKERETLKQLQDRMHTLKEILNGIENI